MLYLCFLEVGECGCIISEVRCLLSVLVTVPSLSKAQTATSAMDGTLQLSARSHQVFMWLKGERETVLVISRLVCSLVISLLSKALVFKPFSLRPKREMYLPWTQASDNVSHHDHDSLWASSLYFHYFLNISLICVF